MARSFDYSKWDNIELSDDESDLHPNIDKDSWFRMKHRTRLEREEREDKETQDHKLRISEHKIRLNIINARLKGIQSGEADEDAEFEDVDALAVEKQEIEKDIAARESRIADIEERRKWNIDNICKVKDEKTIVNRNTAKPLAADITAVDAAKSSLTDEPETSSASEMSGATPTTVFSTAESSSAEAVPVAEAHSAPSQSIATAAKATAPAKATAAAPSTATTTTATTVAVNKGIEPAASVKRERLAVISYNDYCIAHEALLETYSEIADLEATKDFLFKHCDVLLHEHAQSYMLLSCLEDEMNGKHKRMKLVCRQSQILSHIHDLGTSMHRDPRDVILPFFHRISQAEYLKGFFSSVEDFVKRIQKRAVEKRREMDEERREELRKHGEAEYEGEEQPHPLGPGGLDPFEVLKSLPKSLRDAFESQDIERLQDVLANMEPQLAKSCMKKCVDSGLWVPKDASVFDTEEIQEDDLEEIPAGEA